MSNLNNALKDIETISRNNNIQFLLKEILSELKSLHQDVHELKQSISVNDKSDK